ncbi:MAG: SDR family oxidoreductase [Pseudomonadota bacterium]
MTASPQVVCVAGAARGIGLGFVESFLARTSVRHVFALARHASTSSALQTLSTGNPGRLSCIDLDITDESALETLASRIAAHSQRLDWIINTVGLLHQEGAQGLQPERKLGDIEARNIRASFEVNSIGPVLLAKHLAPLLPKRQDCVFASLSARVGSISDNRLGGWYAYRAAKAAQNMLIKTLSIELKRRHKQIRCVALHPGTVATDLSAPFRGNSKRVFSVAESVEYLMNVLDKLNDDDNGQFFAWDGESIPW